MTSWHVDQCTTKEDVEAARWIASLSGIAALDLDPTRPITSGGAEEIHERLRIPRNDSRAERYLVTAEGNAGAARVLSIIGAAPCWDELQMIMQLVDADSWPRTVLSEGWITPRDHLRLTSSFARSVDCTSEKATVMTLRGAESHVRRIVGCWIHRVC